MRLASRRAFSTGGPVAIDMHSHFLPKDWPDFAARHGGTGWPSMRSTGQLPEGTYGYSRSCDAMLMSDNKDFRPVTRACWDVAARLEDCDRAGVSSQVISATPILFQWERDAAAALDVTRHFNDAALEMCAPSGGRLHALCQVPLQHVDAACLELERAMADGHVGVQIGNHVGLKDLDDEGIVTFLQHAASLDAAVLIHPWDMDPVSGRLQQHMMGWTVGMPLETHLSITAMILGGAFDRLPPSLRLCFAHGGGAFPYLLGRLENAWHERALARGKSLHPPSHYLDRFSVDSAVFDERALRLLVETMGATRVMLGSDYPFPLGEQRIGSLVRGCAQLSEVERELILGENAARFFGVPLVAHVETPPLSPQLQPPRHQYHHQYQQQQQQQQQQLVVDHEPRHYHEPPPSSARQQQLFVSASSGARFASPPPSFALRVPGAQHAAMSTRASGGLAPSPSSSPGAPRRFGSHQRRRRLGTLSAAAWEADAADDDAPDAPHAIVVANHIDGAPREASGGASLPLIDAASGRRRGVVAASSAADVADAVASAASALARGEWASASPAERARVLWRAASLLEADADAFAAAESADTGKPRRLAAALDVARAVANLRFFAGLVEHGGGGELRHGGGADRGGGLDDALSYSIRKPVGVVGLVTPWNLPLYLLTWKLGPALAMGNAVVAKPSELTPTTATMLAPLLERAGLPPGNYNVVHGSGAEAGAALCAHPQVGALSFTGGTATGAAVAAAVAPRFAKLSLELGGKNAMVVFADCDFELTVEAAVRASFLNAGQICLCASRILIEDDAPRGGDFYERFASAYAARAAALTVGHPADETTDVGPLVSAAQRAKVARYAEIALAEPGVVARCGGATDARAAAAADAHGADGHWFAPTVLDGCGIGSRVAQEEVFGPLVTLHRFTSEEEAVAAANATKYGLAASVWTEDVSRAHGVAAALDAGTVWVNCWLHRQLHMPFGGVKASGVGREGGEASLSFFSETSTVCLKLGRRAPPPMPGLKRPSPPGAGIGAPGGARRGLRTSAAAASAAATDAPVGGMVASAPSPMGAYSHARRVGDVLFLAGIGPRDAATNEVPGGPVEDPAGGSGGGGGGVRNDYDAAAQTRACIANVEGVLRAHGLGLEHVVDVHAFLIDMKRDFKAFNAEYAAAFGALPITPTRTTVEVQELPPGGRIAVELKVIAQCTDPTP